MKGVHEIIMRRTDILERKEEILQWIKEEKTKAFISQQLQCKQETLNTYLKQMGIEYAGQQSKKGQYKGGCSYIPANKYFDGTKQITSSKLRDKLFRDGLKEQQCEICGITEWYNVKIPLELHHKDNNHFNNAFENLQILCPNCHSIMGNNSGANIGAYTKSKEEYFCSDCGAVISKGSESGKCKSCAAKSSLNRERKVSLDNRPNRDELKTLIRNQSFLEIGRKYGVSDNAVRKWCKTENLPSTKKEINTYSDEEWDNI